MGSQTPPSRMMMPVVVETGAGDLLARLKLVEGRLVPKDVDVVVTRNYGQTAQDKANELLFHLALATSSIVVLIGLMGKLQLPPFDAPEAETEVVAGALTEYSGRGLALFRLGKGVVMVTGLTLAAAFYLGGVANPFLFFLKTLFLLLIIAGIQAILARLRIDQTVGLWWRYGALLVLAQWLIMIGQRVIL